MDKIHQVVGVVTRPVCIITETVHKGAHKRKVKIVIGIAITLVGSTMATHPVAFIPHVIWDAIAYTLHGYGALPAIKVLCEKLNLESLDEDDEVTERKPRMRPSGISPEKVQR